MIIDGEIKQPHIGYFEDINKIVELSHVYYHNMSNSYELRFKNYILSLRSLIFSQQDISI